MRHRICLLIALLLPLSAPTQETEPSIHTTVNEVMLDVVVRDKKAHIIRDLRPQEVQVFEDGVPQQVRHFEFFDGHASPPPSAVTVSAPEVSAAPPAHGAPTPPRNVQELRDISVVSVVVSNLDQQGRKLTLDTMRDFVKNQLRPNTYVGVFWLDLYRIRPVQLYTNDAAKISSAMLRVVEGVGIQGQRNLNGLRPDSVVSWTGEASERTLTEDSTPDQPSSGPVGAAIANLMSTQWVNEMHDVYQDSMSYLTQLHTLVQSQAAIPGRKVVLLFSSGLPIHPDTVEVFKSVISAANRANVSVYAIDTVGPTRESLANSRRLLARAAASSMAQQRGLVNGGDQRVTADQVLAMDLANASIRADTGGNLAVLAEGTGGALLSTSMDLPKLLGRALEEVQTHYELSYSPTNSNTDGSFRNVSVKVTRPGAVVFARSGYFALPLLNEREIYPFEMVTLKALNSKPLPKQFDFYAAALQFRPGRERTQFSFVFQVPITSLTVTEEKPWEKVHVDVTVLVKDEGGQVVQKISRDVPYQMPMSKKAELRRGLVSFTAPFLLSPGRYTLETAAVDRQSMKASVHRSVVIVGHGSGLSMSDIALVRRMDAIEGLANSADPLQAKGGKVTPELSGSVQQESGGQVQFYAAAYPPLPMDAPVEVSMEIARDGRTIIRSLLSEVPPESTGVIPVLMGVAKEKLPPGHYEAQLTFRYKGQNVSKLTAFSVDAQNSPFQDNK